MLMVITEVCCSFTSTHGLNNVQIYYLFARIIVFTHLANQQINCHNTPQKFLEFHTILSNVIVQFAADAEPIAAR